MDSVKIKVAAKVNLGLDVMDKNKDGYHEIKTIMHSINIFDTLYFEKSDEIKRKFSQTVAFDTVMTKLLHDDISAANFVNGIISSDMAAKLAEKRAEIATNQA